jgi:hypothetical protein
MPFKKGNKLGEKGKGKTGMRKKMYNEVSEQLIALSPQYNSLLCDQMEGREVNKEQKEGMDRFEKMYVFAKPKLANVESKVKVDGVGFLLGINNKNEK